MPPNYAAFTRKEHQDRLARARAALREAGYSLCVSVAPEPHYYLAGYDAWVGVNSPQALIFRVDRADEPVLVVRNVDCGMAIETTWLRDIRTYQLHEDDFASLVANIADDMGYKGGRIACELQSYALPASLYLQLASVFAPEQIDDATQILGALRLIKSDREIEYMRVAAGYVECGLEAARNSLRPGMTEIDLAGAVESAMRRAGSDFWAIPTELASGLRTVCGHGTPREKVIDAGDLVHLEFAGVHRRYHCAAIHTMSCGEPSARHAELYEAARLSLAAGIAACTRGAIVSEIENASLEPLVKLGLEKYARMRFGYGLGLAYPPIWLETLQISRGFDDRLQPGMAFVLHSYLQLDEEDTGIIQGGTYLMTDDGLEQLAGGGDCPLDVRQQ